MLSLATGMLSGMAIGPYSGKETGETALFRQLLAPIPNASHAPFEQG